MGGIEDEFNTISSEHDTEQFLAAANHYIHMTSHTKLYNFLFFVFIIISSVLDT